MGIFYITLNCSRGAENRIVINPSHLFSRAAIATLMTRPIKMQRWYNREHKAKTICWQTEQVTTNSAADVDTRTGSSYASLDLGGFISSWCSIVLMQYIIAKAHGNQLHHFHIALCFELIRTARWKAVLCRSKTQES